MNRLLRLLVLSALIAFAATAAAAVYPAGTAISFSRQFPAGYIPIGIPAAVNVTLTNNEGGFLSGLYYSEQYPSWLSVQAGQVRINGLVVAFTYEYGDVIVAGKRSHRWVIDNPSAPGGRDTLGPGDVLTITYTIRATQISAMTTNGDGWFGELTESGEEIIVNGWDALSPIVRFVQNTDAPPLAAGTQLAPAYPNPFNPSTTLKFENAVEGALRLVIVDGAGRRQRELAAGRFAAGQHSVVWDGRDDAGRPLPSGLYLAQLVGEQGLLGSQKLMLLK
ncbi:hypothetical protein FJ251_08725 [bacterium]|nr:hypothetical protein [bacterium]